MTLREHVLGLIARLVPVLFLQEWNYKVEWKCRPQYSDSSAHIDSDVRYLRFHVFFNEERLQEHFDKGEADELAMIVLHELCHTLTEPLYLIAFEASTKSTEPYIEGVRERQTQRIANIVFAQLPKAFYQLGVLQ